MVRAGVRVGYAGGCFDALSARLKEGRREGKPSVGCSAPSSSSAIGAGNADTWPVSFLNVLCESEVRSFVAFSSGVVGVEEKNSDDAEWNVASDAVDAEGGCG